MPKRKRDKEDEESSYDEEIDYESVKPPGGRRRFANDNEAIESIIDEVNDHELKKAAKEVRREVKEFEREQKLAKAMARKARMAAKSSSSKGMPRRKKSEEDDDTAAA